jgi:hypothetical protein
MAALYGPDPIPELPIGLFGHGTAAEMFEPFDFQKRQIRLLTTTTTTTTTTTAEMYAAFTGTIMTVDLEDAPAYYALSYTWGAVGRGSKIAINGHSFLVSERLNDFLLLLQARLPGSYIWIDQICINQKSYNEKSMQVPLMMDIYRGAQEVIIWPEPNFDVMALNIAGYVRGEQDEQLDDEDLSSFTENRYWGRTWIVEEILCASALVIWFGNEIISWEDFCQFAKPRYIDPPKSVPQKYYGGFEMTRFDQSCEQNRLWFFAEEALRQKSRTAAEILMHTVRTNCKDRKDLWYGVQGLLEPKYRSRVQYDSRTSVLDVYCEAVVALFWTAREWDFSRQLLSLAYRMGLFWARLEWEFWHPIEDNRRRSNLSGLLAIQQVLDLGMEGSDGLRRCIRDDVETLLSIRCPYGYDPLDEFYADCGNAALRILAKDSKSVGPGGYLDGSEVSDRAPLFP